MSSLASTRMATGRFSFWLTNVQRPLGDRSNSVLKSQSETLNSNFAISSSDERNVVDSIDSIRPKRQLISLILIILFLSLFLFKSSYAVLVQSIIRNLTAEFNRLNSTGCSFVCDHHLPHSFVPVHSTRMAQFSLSNMAMCCFNWLSTNGSNHRKSVLLNHLMPDHERLTTVAINTPASPPIISWICNSTAYLRPFAFTQIYRFQGVPARGRYLHWRQCSGETEMDVQVSIRIALCP